PWGEGARRADEGVFRRTTDHAHGQTISFRDFSGSALTTLRAGFALYCIGCLVKGLIPCLALVAGLCTTLSLSKPGTTKTLGPFFPSGSLINSANPSKTLAPCFFVRPLDSANRA